MNLFAESRTDHTKAFRLIEIGFSKNYPVGGFAAVLSFTLIASSMLIQDSILPAAAKSEIPESFERSELRGMKRYRNIKLGRPVDWLHTPLRYIHQFDPPP